MKKTVTFFIATGIFLGSFAIAGAVSTLVVQQGGSGRGTFTSSQLIYGNGINALSSVATSSIGAGTGLTFSGTSGAQVGGANGTFSVNTTQNITTLSNLSTTGTLNNTASGVLYSTATTSVTNGTGISFTGTAGALIGGTSLTITNTGVTSLAVTAPITTSGSTGSVTVGCASCLTANQTITLTGAVTGSGSTAITTAFGTAAANTVLANGTGATAVPTFVATSTLFTGTIGQNAYFNGTGLLIGTSTIFTTPASAIGIGTVAPSAKFDVQGTSTASTGQIADFWKSDSSTVLRVRNDGNVGLASTSPFARLSVDTSGLAAGVPEFAIGSSTRTDLIVNQGGQFAFGAATFAVGLEQYQFTFTNAGGSQVGLGVRNLDATGFEGLQYYDQNSTLSVFQGFGNTTHEMRYNNISTTPSFNFLINSISSLFISSGKNVGIGTTTPIVDGNTGSRFLTVGGDAGGANVWSELALGGNITATGAGNSGTPFGILEFYNSNISATDKRTAVIASLTDGATNSGQLIFNTYNAGAGATAMMIDHLGRIGIGTTSPSQTLDVNGNINLEGPANGIVMHDSVTASCYLLHIVSGVITATAHVCQ